ncbi:hypothetical protein ALC62_14725 [Cyphomyrmex costatus]|uniref:SWIM-type domain-containing protein n=1 Tax=Cyphomyrmex costatus TaxID=456900 RepID=A0A151I8G5_9HYME|nr:hypothetical protein ALC62_14725 [Cyphomyrmex costatus]
MFSINEICEWAGTNPSQRNFREGENILRAGHLISCGKHENQTCESESVKLTAYCLQTSQLRASPHEITAEISEAGKIISISCSCKAGLGEKCKHVLATLLYCHRININDLEVLSSTDRKCMWKNKHKDSLSKYQPLPLEQHTCFGKTENNIVITEDLNTIITKLLTDRIPKSAFAKHM